MDLLPLHLLHSVVPGDDASAALVVVVLHYFFEDDLIKRFCTDCADKQSQAAIFGHSHLVLTVFHHSAHMDHHIGIVVLAGCIVGDGEGVLRLD
jgi:hypothetical protein